MDDLREYGDDDMDTVDLDKEVTVGSNGSLNKARIRFQSAEQPSVDLNSIESNISRRNPIEIELVRKKICDLVVYNSYIYLVGHSLFIVINFFQKFVNFFNYNNIDSDNQIMAFFHALSNFIMYSSLGLTFFVHLIYNVKFRYVLKKAWTKLLMFLCCSFGAVKKSEKTQISNKAETKII